MQSSIKYLFSLLVVILVSQTAFAQDSAEIKIIWTQDFLVVVNTSNDNVNLSNLDLVSANGAIMAGDWVMDTYGDSNLSYSLAQVEPGACLLAYPSGGEEQPELPENVECGMTVGMFTMTNFNDIVWDITQGGFSADVAGSSVAECDTTTNNSCDLSVATTASNSDDATDMEADDSHADILVSWNTDIFVVINTSDVDVNISDLSFSSADGAILPENWVMNTDEDDSNLSYSLADVTAGSCLIAYLSADEQPELPENVTCTRTEGMFTMLNINDMVWDASQGGFTAEAGGETIAECDINNTTCDLTVATTSAMSNDMMDDMMDDGAESITAVWTTDILVIINTTMGDADLSDLSFSSSVGEILPENWVMNTDDNGLSYSLEDVSAGSCLVAYLNADEQPDLPNNVTCTLTEGVFAMNNITDMVWDVTHGGFSSDMGGMTVAECDITGNSCAIAIGG